MNNNLNTADFSIWIHNHTILFLMIILWSLFWSGLALWHSAKRENRNWFMIFIVFHTFGILEIIYLFGILKLKFSGLFSNY